MGATLKYNLIKKKLYLNNVDSVTTTKMSHSTTDHLIDINNEKKIIDRSNILTYNTVCILHYFYNIKYIHPDKK